MLDWDKVENRRKFFEEFANDNEFDAYDPNAWTPLPVDEIMKNKVFINIFISFLFLFISISLEIKYYNVGSQ